MHDLSWLLCGVMAEQWCVSLVLLSVAITFHKWFDLYGTDDVCPSGFVLLISPITSIQTAHAPYAPCIFLRTAELPLLQQSFPAIFILCRMHGLRYPSEAYEMTWTELLITRLLHVWFWWQKISLWIIWPSGKIWIRWMALTWREILIWRDVSFLYPHVVELTVWDILHWKIL